MLSYCTIGHVHGPHVSLIYTLYMLCAGDVYPVTGRERFVSIVLMFIGVSLLGYITSSIATMMSVRSSTDTRIAAKRQVGAEYRTTSCLGSNINTHRFEVRIRFGAVGGACLVRTNSCTGCQTNHHPPLFTFVLQKQHFNT